MNTEEEVIVLKTKLDDFLLDHDVSILVNNVGYAAAGFFHKNSVFNILNSVSVNCKAQCLMTSFVLPKLLERAKDGVRSGMINISSAAAHL